MNINGIRTDAGSAISALLLNSNTQSTAGADANSTSASSPASSSSVSKPGELMGKLSQLLQQDPAKFKQVTQQISDELKAQAQSASGPQAQSLTKLSENFAQASTTGSLASLQPPGVGGHSGSAAAHHHHHGGGHHGGGGSAGGIESVLSQALDEVNQALSASSTSASLSQQTSTASTSAAPAAASSG